MKQNRTKKGIKIVKWWVICVFFSSLHSTSLFFLSIALLFICRCFAQENLLTHHSVLLSWNTKTQKILRERERTEKKWMKQSCAHARVLWIGLGKHIHSRTRPSWMGKNDEENSLWRNVGVLQKVLARPINVCKWYHIIAVSACTNALWVCTHRTKSIFFSLGCLHSLSIFLWLTQVLVVDDDDGGGSSSQWPQFGNIALCKCKSLHIQRRIHWECRARRKVFFLKL